MDAIALELNDAGIVAVGADDGGDAIRATSPGIALVEGETIVVGEAAHRRARLRPRFVHDRFWLELDTVPLGRPFPAELTAADLAHAQLVELWRELGTGAAGAVLAVPSAATTRWLGLLLGVARAAGIPVLGMVDAAVAAAANAAAADERILYLDLERHRAVLAELLQGDELVRHRVELDERVGLARLTEAWTHRIAAQFLRATRFDPLHDGRSEQQLVDRLPEWLAAARREGRAVAALDAAGREVAVELPAAELVAAVEELYAKLVDTAAGRLRAGAATTLLLSERAARLPELAVRLAAIPDTHLVLLPAAAAARGALQHAAALRRDDGEGVPFAIRLPRAPAAAPPAGPPALARERADAGDPPTHLLVQGRAYPITAEPFTLGVALPAGERGCELSGAVAGISRSHCRVVRRGDDVVVEDRSTYGTFLDGRRVAGCARLRVGDRLRLGTPGVEIRFIRVEDDGGAA